jgi:hypothetical protein
MMQVMSITIESFGKRDQDEFYRLYRKIKYEVFSQELGWQGLADPSGEPIAREDPFDDAGRFILAKTDTGRPIGVVRGIGLNEGFPHRALFEHHFTNSCFQRMYSQLTTVNALAVLPEYRKRAFCVAGRDWIGSAGTLLMLSLFRSFEQDQRIGAIATAGGLTSAVFFQRLGCLVIDAPFQTALHHERLANFGIVFGSESHQQAEKRCRMNRDREILFGSDQHALMDYFHQCQERSLGLMSLEKRF